MTTTASRENSVLWRNDFMNTNDHKYRYEGCRKRKKVKLTQEQTSSEANAHEGKYMCGISGQFFST